MARGLLLGILIGAVFGAGGVYLALERPWAPLADLGALAPDAGVEGETSGDGERRAKRRRGRRKRPGSGAEEPQVIVLSAADREAIWRGPEVRLPDRDLDFGGESGGRPLSGEEINAGIVAGKERIFRCIAEARGDAELRAQIKLVFLVSGRGQVGDLRIHAPRYLQKNGLYPCVRSAVRAIPFPATGADTVVRVPLDLS